METRKMKFGFETGCRVNLVSLPEIKQYTDSEIEQMYNEMKRTIPNNFELFCKYVKHDAI